MKKIFPIIFSILAATALAAPQRKMTIADFTSSPSGAEVYLDGNKLEGATPIKLPNISPGAHRAVFELKGYETENNIFNVGDSVAYVNCKVELKPIKGLLLLTSEPDGCEVTEDGISFGETPRLITTLDSSKPHTFSLKKNGYKPSTIQVSLDGRTPKVVHTKLLSDSGSLTISSLPAEAEVAINGIVQTSKTPFVVHDIPKGKVEVTISKEGYETVTKTMSLVAGSDEIVSVQLEGKKGKLFLNSVPDGARFYINDKPLGKSPVTMDTITPGTYLIRAELEGHGTISRHISIPRGESVSEEFRLASVTGKLEIRTTPAEAQIIVDGHSFGRTKTPASGADTSEYLSLDNLSVGEHEIVIKRDGYRTEKKHPKIGANETTQLTVNLKEERVFIPNIEIVTVNGNIYRGIYRDMSDEAYVIKLEKMVYPIPRNQIKSITWLYEEGK